LSRTTGSFKFKLVAYFVLLSLLPMAAAFTGFNELAKASETRLADARLYAGLRAATAAYQQELDGAEASARALASSPDFQRALATKDRRAIGHLLSRSAGLRVEAPGKFRVGHVPRPAAERRVDVLPPEGGAPVGTVVASVPLDLAFTERLGRRAGLEPGDRIVLLQGVNVVAGPPGQIEGSAGRTATVTLGGERYRVVNASPRPGSPVRLGVLTPQERIDTASSNTQRNLLIGLLLTLTFVALAAYLQGRTIVRTIRQLVDAANAVAQGRLGERVPVRGRDELAELGRAFNDMAAQLEARLEELELERRRLREATLHFGEALASTHDTQSLLRAIVETAVEATSATSGILIPTEGDVVSVGPEDGEGERLELPLCVGRDESFGTLALRGPGFSIHDVETAAVLAGHASIALDNARLHAIVERQALVDGLTGLANRRRSEEALAAELARAERFGEHVSLVLADLDWFKSINDRYGHPIGDAVLREFAAVLREQGREVDLPSRWGGEEFAIVLPGTDRDGALHAAERLREALEQRTILSNAGVPIEVTASFGVASYPEAPTQDALVAAADAALYAAKHAGKNRVEATAAIG
jgi:diguanylate cyclase (GGDEF)-like protein